MTGVKKDLILLVADLDMENAVKGLLERPGALKIHPVDYTFYRHPMRDSGCYHGCPDFLRPFAGTYDHAIVMFDREFMVPPPSRSDLEREAENRLYRSGWEDRAVAIVPDPELEMWCWSSSPHVEEVLGWRGQTPDLRSWLTACGDLRTGEIKPDRPKEAMRKALERAKKPRSARHFYELSSKVNFSRCSDPAFLKFKATLRRWFPA